MAEQLALSFEAHAPVWSSLPCAFGSLGPSVPGFHCEGCEAESARLSREFDAAVAAGVYNRLGYTPREWKAAGYPADEWATAKRERAA